MVAGELQEPGLAGIGGTSQKLVPCPHNVIVGHCGARQLTYHVAEVVSADALYLGSLQQPLGAMGQEIVGGIGDADLPEGVDAARGVEVDNHPAQVEYDVLDISHYA